MISKFFLVAFVAFLFWLSYTNMVQTSRDIDLNRDPDPEDLSDWEKYSTVPDGDDLSGSTLGSKIKMEEATTLNRKKNKTLLKYRHDTKPLKIEIDNEKANSIKESELELLKQDALHSCYWQDHSTLTKDEIRSLCLNGWLSANPIFSESISSILEPDCDGALVLGPSDPSSKRRKMICYYQYTPGLENKLFRADMVRCNCAYTNSNGIALGISKQFFYILKVTNEMYCILTVNELDSREAEIVSVYKP